MWLGLKAELVRKRIKLTIENTKRLPKGDQKNIRSTKINTECKMTIDDNKKL